MNDGFSNIKVKHINKIVASAALNAGKEATVIKHLSLDSDHQVSLHFPQGTYYEAAGLWKQRVANAVYRLF